MPNTVNPSTLRAAYQERFGQPCPLPTSRLALLWASTARDRSRGRNLRAPILEQRVAETLALVHALSKEGGG